MKNYLLSLLLFVPAALWAQTPVTRDTLPSKDSILPFQRKVLQAVQVTGTKPIVERKMDRTVFNVENSAIASNGTVWEALNKAPGVQIKSDNSLSADKKSVQVYLDGKPLHLSGDDLANYLQGMPSAMISKIEVFSTPPANFDAEGGAIINIVTKKTKTQGFNMTMNGGLTQASYGSYSASSVFNFRKDRLNIYGSYAYSDRKFERVQDDFVTYSGNSGATFWDSRGRNLVYGHTNGYNIGADYQLAKDQTIGVLASGSWRFGGTNTNTPTTVVALNTLATDSTLLTSGRTTSKTRRQTYGLNYMAKFDSGKQSLSLDLDYSPYHYSPLQYVDNITAYPDGHGASDNYHIFTDADQQIRIYWGNIDYSYSLGKSWTLASGAKYSSISTASRFDFYDNAVAPAQYVPGNSNDFLYTEKTSALYADVTGKLGRLTLEGGLRGEETHTLGYSVTLDSLSKRQYFKLFPTVYVDYKLDGGNELQLRYSYRVDRPGYALLNPAKHYANPYNYLAGNPALQPAFIQNVELAYVIKKDFTVSAFYTATHDFFSNVTVQDNTNDLFFDTFANLNLSLSTGLKFAAVLRPLRWWEMSSTIQGYYAREQSTYLAGSYDFHRWSFDMNTLQSFTIDRRSGLKAEISGFYYSPSIQAIFRNGHNSEVDAGIKVNVLKGRGALKLAANDIFFGNTYRIRVNYLTQNNGFYQTNDTRSGSLTFTYRFGSVGSAVRKPRSGSEEEKRF